MLADVGLLGMPNAGKSTLIAAISNARPKIADYPSPPCIPTWAWCVWPGKSFVVADIPGLIEGASEGAGLGHLFLRHLQRTRVLLHVVDLAPFDEGVDPVAQAKAIVNELKIYDQALFESLVGWCSTSSTWCLLTSAWPRWSTSSNAMAGRAPCSRSRADARGV